jgi:hypothetical protein
MKIVTKMKILTQAFWVGCCNSALPAWYAHSLLYFEKQDSGCLGLYLSTSGLSSHINLILQQFEHTEHTYSSPITAFNHA